MAAAVTVPVKFTPEQVKRIAGARGHRSIEAWLRSVALEVARDMDDGPPAEADVDIEQEDPAPAPLLAIASEPQGAQPAELGEVLARLEQVERWSHVLYAELRTQAIWQAGGCRPGLFRRLVARLTFRSRSLARAREQRIIAAAGDQLTAMRRLVEGRQA